MESFKNFLTVFGGLCLIANLLFVAVFGRPTYEFFRDDFRINPPRWLIGYRVWKHRKRTWLMKLLAKIRTWWTNRGGEVGGLLFIILVIGALWAGFIIRYRY